MSGSKTHAPFGDKNNMVVQAAGLFAIHGQRNSTIAKLTGKMPTGTAGAKATIKKQSSKHMPIVQAMDLTKGKGDEVEFQVLQPYNAKPIMGSRVAEGRGTGMTIGSDRLRVNQARFPIDLGDEMTTIRSPVDFRSVGREVAQDLMERYCDQSIWVHLAGDRGSHNNHEWVVPLNTDPDFAEIMINPVRQPTKNRHFVAAGSGVTGVVPNSGELTIATTDSFSMDTVDSMRTVMDQMKLPLPPVKFEGDQASSDSPLRVWVLSPAQYNKFAADPAFRQLQSAALARASLAGNHPLFKGEAGLWNGFLLIKMPRPIRFYAGDDIRYSASHTSDAASTVKVPASFTNKFAVDRSIILGGQALVEAFGKSERTQLPFFWSEKLLDHDDKMELLIGTIRGMQKIQFEVDLISEKQFTDYGICVVDTVVDVIPGELD